MPKIRTPTGRLVEDRPELQNLPMPEVTFKTYGEQVGRVPRHLREMAKRQCQEWAEAFIREAEWTKK